MSVYATPGVYYEAVDQDSSEILSLRTDIAAFVGIAERGPVNTPVAVTSWKQFQSVFGNFIPQGYLAYSVKAFFENGGDRCQVVRIAASIIETKSDIAAIQPADGHSSIVLSVDGFVKGAVVTVTRDATRQSGHLLKDVLPATRELVWPQPLEPLLLGAPLTFATGASAASSILLDGAGIPTLRVEGSSTGKWGNCVAVGIAHTSGAATKTRDAIQPVSRLASLVSSLTGIVAGSLIKVVQDQGGGVMVVEHPIVKSLDAGLSRIVWDTPLGAAFDITKPATMPIYFESVEFALSVSVAGRLAEVFTGLSLVPSHPRYASTVVAAESQQIRLRDLSSPSPIPQNLPAAQSAWLQAGRDGIAALQMLDFTGVPADDPKRGISTLEDVDEVAILAVPDILIQPAPPTRYLPPPRPIPDPCALCPAPPLPADPPPPPLEETAPTFTPDEIFYVQQAMVNHCEAMKYRIAVLDAPLLSQGNESREIAAIQQWRQRFDSKFAALYFPWAVVYDPLQLGGNVVRSIPPSGHVVGTYAGTDLKEGVHRAPANFELRWIQDLTVDIDPAVQSIFNPAGINCLRTFPGRGLRVYGARTVSSDPAWRYVSVRRLMMMIEKSLEYALQWVVFEPNNSQLRLTVSGAVSTFLEAVYEAGALAGATDNEAFYVKCDASNNPPALAAVGQFEVEIGVAPAIPAEFIVFRVGRTHERLEVSE